LPLFARFYTADTTYTETDLIHHNVMPTQEYTEWHHWFSSYPLPKYAQNRCSAKSAVLVNMNCQNSVTH